MQVFPGDPGEATGRVRRRAALLRVDPPRLSLPGAVLEAVAPAVERGWAAARLAGEPPLTRYRASLMRRDVVFDAGAVTAELGLRPGRSRRRALREALAQAAISAFAGGPA